MLRNKLVIAGMAIVFLLQGCVREVTEYSPELTEEATVVDVVYVPSRHGDGVGPTVGSNGEVGLAFTSVDIPEKYAVVFECQHGKFIIEHNQEKTKELWQRLHRDQKVTVTYREEYRAKYDGEKLIERRLHKYDFIDAK